MFDVSQAAPAAGRHQRGRRWSRLRKRAESSRLLPQPVNDARSPPQCSTFLPDHTIPTLSSSQEGESGQWLNDKVSDSAPRTARTPKVTAFLRKQCASIMYVVAVLFLFVCAYEGSRKVFRWSRSYLCECPNCRSLRRVSSVLRSAAERRRRRQLARWGDSLNFFHLHRHSDVRQCRQASRQAATRLLLSS